MKQATKLPEPNTTGTTSLEEALAKRHSRREFTSQDLDLQQISQLLWAAQGITHKAGFRTAPSAGALFGTTAGWVSEDMPANTAAAMTRTTTIVWIMFILLFSFIFITLLQIKNPGSQIVKFTI